MYKLFYTALGLMIIFVMIVSIFSLKVRLLEKSVDDLNKQIVNNHQTLQNLKAEWNYLNNPKYLKPIVKKYLPNMQLDNNKQEVDKLIDKIPFKSNATSVE